MITCLPYCLFDYCFYTLFITYFLLTEINVLIQDVIYNFFISINCYEYMNITWKIIEHYYYFNKMDNKTGNTSTKYIYF